MSAGLEGRSSNPVALLVDALLRPNTDIGGVDPPSLIWEYDPQKAIPHVVIGRGHPGGSWQYMEPNLKSLSLGNWLDLPLYSFADWMAEQQQNEQQQQQHDFDHMTKTNMKTGRVLVGDVASYYSDYVVRMHLSENFLDKAEIDQVINLDKTLAQVCSKVTSTSGCSSCLSSPTLSSPDSPQSNASPSPQRHYILSKTEWENCTDICSVINNNSDDCGIHCLDGDGKRDCTFRWYLRGSQKTLGQTGSDSDRKKVCVFSKKLVLACGVSDHVRWLGVPGEESQFVTHHIPKFIEQVNAYQQIDTSSPAVVVVVGAGLSAADAILQALGKGLKVIHVFRQNPHDQHLIFDRIPQHTYPGYGHLYGLMKGKEVDECYICRSQSYISEFKEDEQSASILNSDGQKEIWMNISFVGVFIGSDADLGFLPDNLVPRLGTDSSTAIDAKHNPIDVNQISFVSEAVSSLYAIGSLTGDNFVRFGIGSALGAAQHILGLNCT